MAVRLRIREVAEGQDKGWNMSRLSRATDISFNTIRRLWQQPYTGVNVQTLSKIADVLGVDVSDLMETIPDDQISNNPNNHNSSR